MTEKNIVEVMEILDRKINRVGLRQFRSCQAWVSLDIPVEVGIVDDYVSTIVNAIVSYDTVVGFADVCNGIIYEYGKYTPTTSKQFTQICNSWYHNYKRVFVDVDTSDRFVKKDWRA